MESVYKCISPVNIRIAMGDIESYDEMLKTVSNDESSFAEAILVASFDLYKSLSKTNQKSEELNRSLLKYKLREATRCTPYGLFAGVGVGNLGAHTYVNFSNQKISKRTRIDMKWLYGFLNEIIENDEVLLKLKVKYNKMCYPNGNRLINPSFSAGGNGERNQGGCFTIRYTEAVKFVISNCENNILCNELICLLAEQYDVSKEKAQMLVFQLIKKEFLLVELFPPIVNTNPLEYVIDTLERIDERNYVESLRQIGAEIEKYDRMSIGKGEGQYLKIRNTMRDLLDSKDFLQVDSKVELKSSMIGKTVTDEVENVVNMLTRLSVGYEEQNYISKYKEEFLEKYGYSVEVPLLEMLDYNMGIGIPANYKNSKKPFINYSLNNKYVDLLNKKLLNKAVNAIENGKKDIVFTDADVDEIVTVNETDRSKLLNSLDLFIQIIAPNTEKIDEGEFKLALSGCVASGGGFNTLGRFSDMFWEKNGYDLELLKKEKELLGDEYVIAELVEQFSAGRIANVDLNTNSTDYQICIGCNGSSTKKEIDIDDIYIGVDPRNNQFYAKSKCLQKRIYARTTHMLNNIIGSSPYRFLRDISSLGTKYQIGEVAASIGNNELEYFPRIIYGKTIIQPARWRIDTSIWKSKSFEEWDRKFKMWLSQNNVPDYVDYTTGDNFLTLNINKERYRELLYYSSKKIGNILLAENYNVGNDYWLKDSEGVAHCAEIVVTCVKKFGKENEISTNKETIEKIKKGYHEEKDRIFFPGEDGWYFYKLYGMSDRKEEFLGNELKELVERLKDIITEHFFIRYYDSREHIRVRFKVKSEQDNIFHSIFKEWLIVEREKGMISDVTMSVYERELERYGGQYLIDLAENYFCKDSIFVEQLKDEEYNRSINTTCESIAIWAIKGVLDSFGYNMQEAEQWLSINIAKNENRNIYRKNEKMYRESLDISKDTIGESIFRKFRERNVAAEQFFCELRMIRGKKLVTNSETEILSSFIHMFCNRYMGDNSWERVVRSLTRHSLHSEIEYKKHHREK